MLCDELKVFVSRILSPLLLCGLLGDISLQLSFGLALIKFNLKRFLSFFILIALFPLVSSRFVTLAEFGTLAESCTMVQYSFGLLADC